MPGLVLAGLMLRAPGMLLSSVVRQPETSAGVMNFVIFPMSFALVAMCVGRHGSS
jgi:ABC-2 type transport system permease protein